MNEVKKLCADCKTTKTPLWRSGPNGPRSLCNACGIRHRKRKMADNKPNPNPEIKREKPSSSSSSSSSSNNPIGEYEDDHHQQMNESLKMRFSDLGNQTIVQRSSSSQLKRQKSGNSKKKLGEVEQAAVLLMSLSCGSVFA